MTKLEKSTRRSQLTPELVVLLAFAIVFGAPVPTVAQPVGGVVEGLVVTGPNDPAPRDTPATGRSIIRGRVLAADGRPMRRAIVAIRAPELRVVRSTLTGADGRYEFRDLPPGRYSISASKTSFVSWTYGQTQPGSPGRPLLLAGNQAADNINISLPPGAVVTGRVIDEFGDPAPNVSVNVLRSQFMQGQQRLVSAGTGGSPSTNDIGEYRIFGLPPGQYYVAAQPLQQSFALNPANSPVEGQEARNGYARTFYPGTADVGGAQKVTLGIGQTASEINIVLLTTRVATISGVAVDSQGQRLGRTAVQIMPRGGVIQGMGASPLGADGTFSIPNVPPGQYILRAVTPRIAPAQGPPPPPEFSIATVTVNGEDVTDVRLAPIVPVPVSGRISFDDPAAAQSITPSAIKMITQHLDDAVMAGFGLVGGPPSSVQEDLTFEIKTAPGRIALRALAGLLQVRAIRINGRDITDAGLEVGGEPVTGVEIELTSRRQEISGAVTDAGGGALNDYSVIVFAQDRNRWGAPFNRYFATGRPGDDGRFKVGTLPAGEYYAIALDGVDPSQSQDPDFLDGLVRHASPFSLGQGDSRTLDLRLFTMR